LARAVAGSLPNALVLGLKHGTDRARLTAAELFFAQHRDQFVVLDEVQSVPGLFSQPRASTSGSARGAKLRFSTVVFLVS
jgi:hypothetical protein